MNTPVKKPIFITHLPGKRVQQGFGFSQKYLITSAGRSDHIFLDLGLLVTPHVDALT